MFNFQPNANLVITINPNQDLTPEALKAVKNGATLFDLFVNDVFEVPLRSLESALDENTQLCMSQNLIDCPDLSHPLAYLLDEYDLETLSTAIDNIKTHTTFPEFNVFVLPNEYLTPPIGEFLSFLNDPSSVGDKLTFEFQPLSDVNSIEEPNEPSTLVGSSTSPTTPTLPIPITTHEESKAVESTSSKKHLLIGAIATMSLGLYLIHRRK